MQYLCIIEYTSTCIHCIKKYVCAINIRTWRPEMKKYKKTKKKKTRMVLVKWVKPSLGWFKLNTDGSSIQHRRLVGGRRVIWDAFKNRVVGFSTAMDFTTSVMAELSALHDRLVMAKKLRVAKIVVELDAKVVVNLVTNSSKAKKSMERIVMECKNLLQDFEEYMVQHMYLEGAK